MSPLGQYQAGWNEAVKEAAKLLRAAADRCAPGSPAEQQNWPFALESAAREVEKKLYIGDAEHG